MRLRSMLSMALALLPSLAVANPPVAPGTYSGPASVTAKVDDLLVRIDGPKLWTLSRIEFKGSIMAIEDSAYGCVVNIKDVGFIGSAHKENETEQVLSVRFLVDGKEIQEFDKELSGKSFVVERTSRIRSMDFDARLEVTGNRLYQSVRIRNSADVPMNMIYPVMYAWTPQASLFQLAYDDGRVSEGKFRQSPEKARHVKEENVRWSSVFVPSMGKGVVTRLLERPATGNSGAVFTDGPGVYRKFYFRGFNDQTLPAGFDGTYRVVSSFFEADESTWSDKARALSATLVRDQ